MKIQSGNFRRPAERKGKDFNFAGKLTSAAKLVVFLLALGAVVNGYIYLNQRISESVRAARLSEREAALAEKEIETLSLENEKLKRWAHIQSRIEHFKLGLRFPEPRQVRRLAVMPPPSAPPRENTAVASR